MPAIIGRITEIDLVFAAPNMWNGTTETEKGVKELDKEHGVKETEIKLRNPDGKLNPGPAPSVSGVPARGASPLRGQLYFPWRGRIKAKVWKENLL